MIGILKQYNVRMVVDENNKEWFCANDVAEVLGIENIRMNIKRNLNEKSIVNFNKSNVTNCYIRNFDSELPNRGLNFIDSKALYKIAFRSNKKEAVEFTDWVTDVIDFIRENGFYLAGEKDENLLGTRNKSKETRKELTDIIKIFVEYAESQGSKSAFRYYTTITNLVRNKIGLPKELKKDDLNQNVLIEIMLLEKLIEKKIPSLIEKNLYYKDIYKELKKLINEF